MELFVEHKSSINLVNHPKIHGRNNHIEMGYYFLRDQVNKGKLKLEYCRLEVQLAGILIKPLKKTIFNELKELIGMRSLENMN